MLQVSRADTEICDCYKIEWHENLIQPLVACVSISGQCMSRCRNLFGPLICIAVSDCTDSMPLGYDILITQSTEENETTVLVKPKVHTFRGLVDSKGLPSTDLNPPLCYDILIPQSTEGEQRATVRFEADSAQFWGSGRS